MDTRTSGSDLWATASADAETEVIDNLFTSVRVEASQSGVLAAADNRADFDNRLELLASQLDQVTASVLTDETEGYYASLRTKLSLALANDFNMVQERRVEATQRHNAALRQKVVAQVLAGAADGTEDPNFLAAPAEGQTGPASTGGTPGSEGEDNASGDGPERDDSKGPNILPSEDVANEVTGSFRTLADGGNLFERRHYNNIAEGIKTAPVDEETREALARHFATHLQGTNENFNASRFIGASTHTASRLDFSRTAADEGKCMFGCGADSDYVVKCGDVTREACSSHVGDAAGNVAKRTGQDTTITKKARRLTAFDYEGSGWTPEGPGHSKNHVWVGPYEDDPNPELGSWLVHYKDASGTILTDSFQSEEDAVGFAQSKAGVIVPPPSTIQEGQNTHYTAAVGDTGTYHDTIGWSQWDGKKVKIVNTEMEWEGGRGRVAIVPVNDDGNPVDPNMGNGIWVPPGDVHTAASQSFEDAQEDRNSGGITDAEFEGKDGSGHSNTDDDEKTAARKTAGSDEWDTIMQHPLVKAARPQIRAITSDYLSAQMGPDSGEGISSSDVNHTFFGYAKRYYDRNPEGNGWVLDAINDMSQYIDDSKPTYASKLASKLASEGLTDEDLERLAAQGNELAATMLKLRQDRSHTSSIDGESWDTGEVALWFDNDYGLYQEMQGASSPSDLERIWNESRPNADVDLSQVNWDAVYADVKDED